MIKCLNSYGTAVLDPDHADVLASMCAHFRDGCYGVFGGLGPAMVSHDTAAAELRAALAVQSTHTDDLWRLLRDVGPALFHVNWVVEAMAIALGFAAQSRSRAAEAVMDILAAHTAVLAGRLPSCLTNALATIVTGPRMRDTCTAMNAGRAMRLLATMGPAVLLQSPVVDALLGHLDGYDRELVCGALEALLASGVAALQQPRLRGYILSSLASEKRYSFDALLRVALPQMLDEIVGAGWKDDHDVVAAVQHAHRTQAAMAAK